MNTITFQIHSDFSIQKINHDIRHKLITQKGVYDVVRFLRKDAALYLTAHLKRFIASSTMHSINMPFSENEIKQLLIECLKFVDYSEFRVKFFFCFGELNGLLFVFEDLTEAMKNIILKREKGVSLGTYQIERLIPQSKSIEWLKLRVDIKDEFLPNVDEGLIVNQHNEILEGLSSNFFYIIDDMIYSANENILNGVTRQILLEKIDINTGFLKVDEIEKIDEAFITSTSRGVIPIRSINSININQASFGQKTLEIANSYSKWVEEYLEILDLK